MTGTTNRMSKLFVMILGSLMTLIIIITVLFYMFGEKRPDLKLEEELRKEYSVVIDVKIMNTSEGYKAFLVPGHVKWDADHKDLQYNLSDPKEAVLAFVEALSNKDGQALELMLTENSREYWKRKGYNIQEIIDHYRRDFKNIDDPYIFSLQSGEDDVSQATVAATLRYASGKIHLELHKQSDGKWKI